VFKEGNILPYKAVLFLCEGHLRKILFLQAALAFLAGRVMVGLGSQKVKMKIIRLNN
jgi:hypothetical protein